MCPPLTWNDPGGFINSTGPGICISTMSYIGFCTLKLLSPKDFTQWKPCPPDLGMCRHPLVKYKGKYTDKLLNV